MNAQTFYLVGWIVYVITVLSAAILVSGGSQGDGSTPAPDAGEDSAVMFDPVDSYEDIRAAYWDFKRTTREALQGYLVDRQEWIDEQWAKAAVAEQKLVQLLEAAGIPLRLWDAYAEGYIDVEILDLYRTAHREAPAPAPADPGEISDGYQLLDPRRPAARVVGLHR